MYCIVFSRYSTRIYTLRVYIRRLFQPWCGVGVCAWVSVLAAPRHSSLGSLGVRVCVCAPHVPRKSWLGFVVRVSGFVFWFSARQSWLGFLGCVYLCAHSACTPPFLAWGVPCGYVCLGSGFGPAPPFLAGLLACVCLCAPFACAPPILAGVCGACVLVQVLAFNPPFLTHACAAFF